MENAARIGQKRGNIQVDKRNRRPPRPLDRASMEELALSYVARFATSAAKLEQYLARKLRERGWGDGGEETGSGESSGPNIPALVARYVELGYVDDEAFARARSASLLRRGYGPRRIGQALNEAGIAGNLRADIAPGEAEQRRAVLAFARKRRFGPFGAEPPDRALREKQIAAMLRAGHTLDNIREIVDAPSVETAENWVAEAEPDDE